jgi:hypothetical protein
MLRHEFLQTSHETRNTKHQEQVGKKVQQVLAKIYLICDSNADGNKSGLK